MTKSVKKKRKINVKHCAICGVGIAIVLGIAVIGVILLNSGNKEAEQPEQPIGSETYSIGSDNFAPTSESDDNSEKVLSDGIVVEEEHSQEITAESIVEDTSESEEQLQYEKIDENIANWETLPAGTILDTEEIDWENIDKYFCSYEISDAIYAVINGKSFQEGTEVGLSDIRYMKLLHYNFEHKLQVGELIVATELQEDFKNIFKELFDAEYEIQSMYLTDNYWTGEPTSTDSASIDQNNTSAFLYRPATGSSKLSKHAYGRAIDINPQQNPYVSYKSGKPVWSHENANDYIDRTTGLPHMITHDDICYQIFMKYGFTWGGDWNTIKDYQHFEKE